MPKVSLGPTTTTEFKTSASLQTKRPKISSVDLEFFDLSSSASDWGKVGDGGKVTTVVDPNEARYWTQKFGLGKRGGRFDAARRKFAHPRSVTLRPSHGGRGSAIVHQVLFGPPPGNESNTSSSNKTAKNHKISQSPLAVVGGPRVCLYGTNPLSPFIRTLSRHSTTTSIAGGSPLEGGGDDGNNSVDPDRSVQIGGNLALCGAYRNDGRLLAVGTDAGDVRVCDVTMRATLATFAPSTGGSGGRVNGLPMRTVEWFRNGQYILSGGDDGQARVWDLGGASATGSTNSKPLVTLIGHGDAIRCAVLFQQAARKKATSDVTEWTQLVMTGSYDHTIRVWNVQDLVLPARDGQPHQEDVADRCVAVMSHGAPVEALCLMKSNNVDVPVWLVSAGGTSIKVWNPVTGECVTTTTTQHRKTITSLVAVPRSQPIVSEDGRGNNNNERILSWRVLTSGLDGLLQFHSWDPVKGNLQHLYSTKIHESSITSVGMDEQGDRIAIGLASGHVLVKMRGLSVEQQKRREPHAGTYSFFQRGMNAKPKEEDYKVTTSSRGKKRKQRNFDIAIRQFRYADALDDALSSRRPNDVIAVLEELGKRRALTIALSNRDEERLEPVVAFAIRNISKPHFTSQIIGLSNKLIDIYQSVAGESEVVDELFRKLKVQIKNECRTQQTLMRVVGQLDAVMAASPDTSV